MNKTNPFTLTFGKHPLEYISRYENTENVINSFDSEHALSQAYLIEGVRGSGKTVLMTTISQELRSRNNWIVVDLIPTRNLLDGFATSLAEECRGIKNLLPSGFNISIAGVGLGISNTKSSESSIILIDRLLKELKKKHKKVLVTIDEVIPSNEIRDFASEFQVLIRKDYPLFLLMTGLYENIYNIQNDPALTFLLRTPKIHMEPLSLYQISVQYESIFNISTEDATRMARITKGYAFAFQALGAVYYDRKDGENLDDVLPKLDAMLDDFVYRKIWESLSDKDRIIVRSIPDELIKTQDAARASNMDSSVFSKYRERLIRKGILYSPQYGYLEYALPRFYDIIQRY